MRRMLYAMNVSIDGFIEAPDGSIEWSAPDEELHRHFNALEKEIEVNFYGRRMYEIMQFWQTAEENPSLHEYELEFAQIWNSKSNLVFSRTLDKVERGDRLIREISISEIIKQKNQPGKYIAVGGPTLAATFLNLGLIDEIRLYIVPIILGGGKSMFQSQQNWITMKLVETLSFHSGVILLRYLRKNL